MSRRAAVNGKALSAGRVLGRTESLAAHYSALWKTVRSASEATPLCLGVTACERGHGVSTVAANLAATAAHSGFARVALIEASTIAPSLARTFHRAPAPGLAEFLRGEADVDACLQETAVDGLCLIAAGHTEPHTSYSDREVQELLGDLAHEFAVVICDLPLASHRTALDWAGRLDGTLLVLEPGQVAADAAQQAKANLVQAGARLLGVVLTKCERIPSGGRRQLD